jgi:hypothetical protein
MPKKPIDYSKNLNYKIVCNDLEVLYTYVGHSTNFKERKRHHKSNCNNETGKSYNFKIYQLIRENGGWNNWSMIKIEDFSCNDVYEAVARERYWYEELNTDLNSKYPNRSNQEYKKEYQKEWYEKNREKLKEKVDCECGGKYTKQHLSRHIKTIKHQNFINNI